MMMTKLGKEGKKHADDRSKRISHLRLGLLLLGCTVTLRVAIRVAIGVPIRARVTRVVLVAGRRVIFLHSMHGNIPGNDG